MDTPQYTIIPFYERYAIEVDGNLLRDSAGEVRSFATRNAARKRVSRERRGNFHA